MPCGYEYCIATASAGPFTPQQSGSFQVACQSGDVMDPSVTYTITDASTGEVLGTDAGGYPLYWYWMNAVYDTSGEKIIGAAGSFRNNGTRTIQVQFVGKCRDA